MQNTLGNDFQKTEKDLLAKDFHDYDVKLAKTFANVKYMPDSIDSLLGHSFTYYFNHHLSLLGHSNEEYMLCECRNKKNK